MDGEISGSPESSSLPGAASLRSGSRPTDRLVNDRILGYRLGYKLVIKGMLL